MKLADTTKPANLEELNLADEARRREYEELMKSRPRNGYMRVLIVTDHKYDADHKFVRSRGVVYEKQESGALKRLHPKKKAKRFHKK